MSRQYTHVQGLLPSVMIRYNKLRKKKIRYNKLRKKKKT